jgi:mandelamide amidase
MARTVSDVALLHEVVSGMSVPGMPDAQSLRIGLPRKPYWEDLEEPVGVVTQQALERLREAGVTFVNVNVGGYYSLAHEIYMTLVTQGIKEDLQPYLTAAGIGVSAREVRANIVSRDTRALFEDCASSQISPASFAKAGGILREKIQLAYRQIFSTNNIAAILFPTSPIIAPLINPNGDRRDAEIELNGRRVNLGQTLFRNTRVTGALGAPGLSLPAGLTREGLPVGLELDGLNGADAELLAVGIRIEQILGPLPPPPL